MTADSQESAGGGVLGQVTNASGASTMVAHSTVPAATALGGRSCRYRLVKLPPKPYSTEANTPASAAGSTLPPEVLPLASTATPTKPVSKPSALRLLIFSPNSRNATMLVNITTVALLIATT